MDGPLEIWMRMALLSSKIHILLVWQILIPCSSNLNSDPIDYSLRTKVRGDFNIHETKYF